MTNAELRKKLVLEMKKKAPCQNTIKEISDALERMEAKLASSPVQVFSASFAKPEPMACAKTVSIELKRRAYKAIERDSIVGDKETQAVADAAMSAYFGGSLTDDEFRCWAARQDEFEMLHFAE